MNNQKLALTTREHEIVDALCQGKCNKRIARHLNISVGTVKVHLNKIYSKLGVQNRTALVILTLTTGLGQ